MNEITELQGDRSSSSSGALYPVAIRQVRSWNRQGRNHLPLDIIWRLDGSPPGFNGNFVSTAPFRNSAISPFNLLSKFPREGRKRGCGPGGLATQGTLHVPGNRGYAQVFADCLQALCPNIPIYVLSYSNHHSQAAGDSVREPTEVPILEQIQSVIHPHPHIAGVVFQQGCDLMARKTIPCANGRDCPVLDVIKRSSVCNPDRAISAGQNACCCICPKPSRAEKVVIRGSRKAVDSICGHSPYDPFPVFKRVRVRYRWTSPPSVCNGPQHCHGFGRFLCQPTDPEIAVAIGDHRR